jgi:hypothetical protein
MLSSMKAAVEPAVEGPVITHGNLLIGFPEWFRKHYTTLKELFTPEAEAEYETLEDFAIEVHDKVTTDYPELT